MIIADTTLSNAFQAAVQNISKKKQVQFVADRLYSQYPVLRLFRPLAIGIDQVIIASNPQFDQHLIRRVLSNHCQRPRYLKTIAKGGKRYGLDGKPCGVITQQEQAIAQKHFAMKPTI
ncbi:MAG: ProQ/FinO family protein [Neisseriales bacterium]|nr:MAG: ProQ/FinO family protein [Neisseriales bacterium]